ncbi:MAG: carboxymuconolactone decarboxylase family protein [Deltaproteobacteria bacterium]|nr:carboxymuconolactone decarboxylase family protein [Deltaproteobacteria bacterium]
MIILSSSIPDKESFMKAFIDPPVRIPFYLRIGLWISKLATGRDLLPGRLLAWYPKTAISSGMMEALVAHHDKTLSKRILKLVRLRVSFAVACPFCIDMNSYDYDQFGISSEELSALAGRSAITAVKTFSAREMTALEYAVLISQTPLTFPQDFVSKLKADFTEREIVILAATAAQVNYWARLLQGLGVPPAGFSNQCSIGPVVPL